MQHDFIISVLDTDSITISKPDNSEFSKQEIDKLTEEINSQSDEMIKWDFEFYIPKLIVVKSKNYIMDFGDGKIKYKGSSIRDQKKEPALRDLMNELVNEMLNNNDKNQLVNIYNKYIIEACNVTDIRRWSAKKTITRAILNCKGYTEKDIKDKKIRRNETTVWDAIVNEDDIQEGNKIYLYPTIQVLDIVRKTLTNGRTKETYKYFYGLKLDKYYDINNSDLDIEQLLKRCYNTVEIFDLILDIKGLFLNYSLTKNKDKINDLIGEI